VCTVRCTYACLRQLLVGKVYESEVLLLTLCIYVAVVLAGFNSDL